MNTIKRILHYAKPYRKTLLISIISAVLFGIVSAVPTYVIKFTIDDIFIKQYHHLIVPFIGIFMGLFALKGLFMYLSSYYMNWVNNKVINDIRHDLLSRIIYFPTSFFQQNPTGKLMSHFLNDVQMIQMAATATIRDGVRSFFEAIALVSFALFQNIKLGLLMIIVGPLLGIIVKKMGKARKSASAAIQMQLGQTSSLLQEIFVGIREIKAFNAEQAETSRFKTYLSSCLAAMMRNTHIECLLPALTEALSMVACGFIFYIAAHQVIDGTITAGQLVSFVGAVLLSYQPLKKIFSVYSEVQYGLAAAERIFAMMDIVYPSLQNRTNKLPDFKDSIVFNNISFAYNNETVVFKQVNLTILKGEAIGLVGPSGTGKSTLCDLLLGFIVPSQGQLLIDGTDINSITLEALRNQIGYVSQRTFLFNDTVWHNVGYANTTATKETIVKACQAAHAHEFIMKLPQGYDTIVGENGSMLSGGQKQRLTIARALLKDPAIIILDEATSALDEESEQMIKLTMKELKGQKTLLIISHRPTMLQYADRIIAIEDRNVRQISKEHSTHSHTGHIFQA
jgi:subfamily B ATP-binding cassette protein MsbA